MTALGRLHHLEDLEPSAEEFRQSVVAGLSTPQKTLPCKFFYDVEGSKLFDRICDLPEYYPTRTECGILEDQAGGIAKALGPQARIVELGSGAGIKIRLLLAALDRPAAYVPVDISREHMVAAATDLSRTFPELRIAPVCADYTQPFALPAIPGITPKVTAGFFPGSTIGNLTPSEAVSFLGRMRRLLGPGSAMIIGVDVPKSRAVLEAAYDDAAGVTAAFNLNLLHRINRELGADFNVARFDHRAWWNEEQSRIEMHLVSRIGQTVRISDHQFSFEPGETIHTENSYKYSVEDFHALARRAGYRPEEVWTDASRLFSVHLLRSVEPS